jgi:hypothetical protein
VRSPRPATWLAALFDICCVLVFVTIGRASHAKGEELAGIASTTWPFLSGLVIGWAAARAWHRPERLWPAGVSAWLCTVAFGMVLRVVSGQGTAVSFIIVALCFLGLFLLGWRAVWLLLERRRGVVRRVTPAGGGDTGGGDKL